MSNNLNSQQLYDNMCPKCNGQMYINEDKDLQCITCAKILVVTIRRAYDTREGKIRDNKKAGIRGDLDSHSEVDRGRVWNNRYSDSNTSLARQRSLGVQRRAGLTSRR